MLTIFKQTPDRVSCKAVLLRAIVFIHSDIIAVELVQTVISAYPYKAFWVLQHTGYLIAYQSVVGGDFG